MKKDKTRHTDKDRNQDERSPERKSDSQQSNAVASEREENVRRDLESSIAGEAGDVQGLSDVEEATEESVEELAASGQAMEASAVAGLEDAADHPERPVRTHEDYRHPDDALPRKQEDDAA